MRNIPIVRRGVVVAQSRVDDADFEWLVRHRWGLHSRGYAVRAINLGQKKTRLILMHREILGLGCGDKREGDHIDGDKLNNCRSNLRVCTGDQNKQNQPARPGSSRHRGVQWDKRHGKWRARVRLNKRLFHLGRFDSEAEAAAVAQRFREVHMPYSVEARNQVGR